MLSSTLSGTVCRSTVHPLASWLTRHPYGDVLDDVRQWSVGLEFHRQLWEA
jgi:hypothetical protein